MTTLADLRQATRTILAAAGQAPYADDELALYINWALTDFAAYRAATLEKEYDEEVDGASKVFALPDDLYQIELVEAEGLGFLEEYDAKPGVGLPATKVRLAYRRRGDRIIFNTAPQNPFTVYYDGYYAILQEDDDELEAPRWADEALPWYAAASALTGKAAGSASISQFDQSFDSGNPEHNPLARVAEKFYARYLQVVQTHTHKPVIRTWRPR